MNKSELITAVSIDADITKVEAGRAVDAVLANLTATMRKGDALVLVGFGTFTPTKRKARVGRNPRTGADVTIPANRTISFKPSPKLKAQLN